MLKKDSFHLPPKWADNLIWYQILVERFRNGDVENDPTIQSIAGGTVDKIPDSWTITPWGHNWYKQENWAEDMNLDFYRTSQLRRYGGDLAGVFEKIYYFKLLGINAIYFNPLNFAPSLHKYDASYYHHIDIHFGPNPEEDLKLIQQENPSEPESWVWTHADKMFLDLIKKLHDHQIRVILDFSWNHTGHTFWAFEDIKKNLEASKYLSWFHNIEFFTKNEKKGFTYGSWNNISSMPEFAKPEVKRNTKFGSLEGNLHVEVQKHIFNVCKRWMDPHGNGEVNKGIDGMRLDVADYIPFDFWKDFRKFTREINPEFFLMGENWWEEWPHKMLNPRPWLQGDTFDSVMHYQWFQVARSYFGDSDDNIDVLTFIGKIQALYKDIKLKNCRVLMNLVASHDTSRLLTTIQNKNKYKYHCKPQEDKNYLTYYPNNETYLRSILLLIHQFTFLGSPHIWNGDEMGMVGADDPDNRKPLHWPDIPCDEETASSYSDYAYSIKPYFDANMFKIYRDLIKLRKKYSSLSVGDCLFNTNELPGNPLLIYTRSWKNEKLAIGINTSKQSMEIPEIYQRAKSIYQFNIQDSFSETMPPFSAWVRFFSG